jgi:hypothetical protein
VTGAQRPSLTESVMLMALLARMALVEDNSEVRPDFLSQNGMLDGHLPVEERFAIM